ncbi:ABC transporter ATP-binding protein [Spiroplasma endosymbiont of Aspidapion aeneum]|uniref:ABC transporter ATP-binding protein n=1 Tax=Spiroplasma endosymbiont of Aspidapion aeneum TaxID=3066276 RepID=UPI00313EFB29
MLKIENIVKTYENNRGIFDVSIFVKPGDIYGLIGPKDSGKTTILRIALGLVKKDSGIVYINNISTWKEPKKIMSIVGYLSTTPSIPPKMTGEKYIHLMAETKNSVNILIIEELIKYFEIDVKKIISKMNDEERRLVSLIVAIMHDPDCLLLDEPCLNISQENKQKIIKLLLKLAELKNKIILISTTNIDGVSKICNKIGFLKLGFLKKEITLNNKEDNIELVRSIYNNVFYESDFEKK